MDPATLRVLAQYAVYFIIFLVVPLVVLMFTDRFSHDLNAGEYAFLFALAAVVGILLFVPAISIVAATALGSLGLAWVTARFALSGLIYHRSLEPARLFPGDEAHFRLHLENRKILPLAALTITDPVQFGLMMPNERYDNRLRFSTPLELLDDLQPALVRHTAVAPYQSVTRTITIRALHRGVYRIPPAQLESGDAFGIFRHKATVGESLEVIVYPRVYRPEELSLPFRETLGEAVSRRWLIEDPTLIKGAREYRPGDPLKRMHWRATARTGQLQVRVFDPSTTAQLMLVLNLNTFQHVWEGIDLERMEAVIELAASLATWALEKDFPIGLRSNGVIPGSDLNPRVSPSADPRQTRLILEHLARLSFSGRFSAEDVLLDESRRLPAGGSIIFVTSTLSAPLISLLTSRRFAGRTSVVYCGRFAAPVVRGLPIHLATPPERETLRAVS